MLGTFQILSYLVFVTPHLAEEEVWRLVADKSWDVISPEPGLCFCHQAQGLPATRGARIHLDIF